MKSAILPLIILFCISCASQEPLQTIKSGVEIIYLTQPPAAQTSPPPVAEANPPPTYKVKQGDTLFDIARHFDLDYQELARINNIGENYIIVPRQVIRLNGSAASPPPRPQPAQQEEIIEKKESQQPKLSWIWPVETQKERAYSLNRKGIDISATIDAYTLAAAAGQVVYAGEELEEYGQLVLISHNEKFLSVYANNAELLVKEGQRVEQGEKIARMGTRANKAHLYFEIRHKGESIDPLPLLPEF